MPAMGLPRRHHVPSSASRPLAANLGATDTKSYEATMLASAGVRLSRQRPIRRRGDDRTKSTGNVPIAVRG
jgi:hypothetical protein